MTESRIPTMYLTGVDTVDATSLPYATFLPTPEDTKSQKSRIQMMIKRTLCSYINVFESERQEVFEHIKHPKWDESTKKVL